MKRILVPTDFSNNAYAALLYVSRLYAKEEVEIVILHSFEEEVSHLTSRIDVGRSDEMIEKLLKQSNKDGTQLIERLKTQVNSNLHHYDLISTSTSLTKAVNGLIAEEHVDLVTVGSKGRTGAEEVLVGSNTIRLTESIVGAPLLIVPYEVHFVLPAKIAFASDYNEFYSLSKLKPVIRLVRHFRSEIHVVNVGSEAELNEEQKENYDRLMLDLSEYDTKFHFTPKKGSISGSLHNFIDTENIDLFSLIYHKHAFLKKLFREPVVSRVGEHKTVPTLVIPTR